MNTLLVFVQYQPAEVQLGGDAAGDLLLCSSRGCPDECGLGFEDQFSKSLQIFGPPDILDCYRLVIGMLSGPAGCKFFCWGGSKVSRMFRAVLVYRMLAGPFCKPLGRW